MKKIKINVLTGVNPINYEYFHYFIKNIRKMSSDNVDLKIKVITGSSRIARNLFCDKRQISSIEDAGAHVINGNHFPGLGESLNHLLMNDPQDENEYTLICDIDLAFVRKNWDIDVINVLRDYDVVGLPFEESKMIFRGPGPDNAIRYQRNPSIVWMMFKNNLAWKTLDFTHSKDDETIILPDEETIYNIPAGFHLAKDVGWRIPKFLFENKLKSFSFDNINVCSQSPRKFFVDIPDNIPWEDGTNKSGWPCDEGYLNDHIVIVHQKLSQRWKFKTSKVSKIFYDKVDEYIEGLCL